jgi:hypothetical protein
VRRWPAALLLSLLGCSDLSGVAGGVVALELRLQTPPVVEQHDTLVLSARALNADGREVAADIFWRSPDSILTVDSTGLVTTDSSSGSGRIQARTGSLLSDLVLLEIHRRSDTVALQAPTTITVPATDTASAALVAAVQSLSPDTVGIGNTRILYEVVETQAATGTLRFQGGQLSLRAATGLTGEPLVPVTLRKVSGATPPATVTVRVSATRPSGVAVPGSGQVFTVNFQ